MSTRAVAPTVAAPVAVVTPLQRPMLQRTCDCGEHTGGGECEECKKKKKMPLQRHGNGVPGPAVAPPLVRDVLRSSGQALDEETQTYFSSRFGYDFSQVRVHSDERAADSAQAVNAHAYTVGRHVVFGSGRYAPHTPWGRTLLSHELSHVMQQTSSPYIGGPLEIGEAHDAAEREAERAERTAVEEPVRVRQASQPRLQGKWDWGRAGWGTLIGGAIVAGGVVAAALLGAPGLAIGLLAGGLVGGFLIGGLTGSDQQPQSKPAPPVPTPPGCPKGGGTTIDAAIERGLTMARSTIAALSAMQPGAKGNSPAGRAREALKLYFKSEAVDVANYVRDRFVQIETAMARVQSGMHPKSVGAGPDDPKQKAAAALAVSCHTPDNDPDCKRAVAYVDAVKPGHTERDSMVFCTEFFEGSQFKTDEARGAIIIHEIAHSILSGDQNIGDRAYSHTRSFTDLTTAEALTNADSYRILALHVNSELAPMVGPLMDDVQDCDDQQQASLQHALALAQRWVAVAQRVTHDRRPAWLSLDVWIAWRKQYLGGEDIALIDAAADGFDKVEGVFGLFAQARCHPQNDQACPPGKKTNTGPGEIMGAPEFQLCPEWLEEKDPEQQGVSILAEMLGSADVTDPQKRQKYAEMAKVLFDFFMKAPPLEKILGGQARSSGADGPSKH